MLRYLSLYHLISATIISFFFLLLVKLVLYHSMAGLKLNWEYDLNRSIYNLPCQCQYLINAKCIYLSLYG